MKKCIITVYYLIDNFCKIYQEWERKRLISSINQRNKDGKLSLAELLRAKKDIIIKVCKGNISL
ncbi:transposase [Orientia tsutsugamushi]|uniref:Transposase n=1 Tax=Orientia tsutsugamushi TaxID=784 RepID=A0A2R8F4M7_ORITS|nr:transposase [Orientia tsutsugamushi]